MSDYIEVAPGVTVDTDGEIVEAAGIDDPMKFLAIQRHEAKAQAKEWEQRVDDLDRVLLKKQGEKRLAYGDTVIAIRGGTYSKTDAGAFAATIAETFPNAFDFEHEEEVEKVLNVIAAASGFKRDLLPIEAIPAYEIHTATLEKRPWVESSIARKVAPVRAVRTEIEQLAEAVAVE